MCLRLAAIPWIRRCFVREKIKVSKEPLFDITENS